MIFMAEEKIYTIPLRDAYKAPRPVRARKAITYLKGYLKKHLKTEDVLIGPGLNHEIWSRGIKKPPRKVKVTVKKEDEKFKAELFGYKSKEKPKKEKKVKKKNLTEKAKEIIEEKKTSKPKEKREESNEEVKPEVKEPEKKEEPKKEDTTEKPKKETKEPEKEEPKKEGEK